MSRSFESRAPRRPLVLLAALMFGGASCAISFDGYELAADGTSTDSTTTGTAGGTTTSSTGAGGVTSDGGGGGSSTTSTTTTTGTGGAGADGGGGSGAQGGGGAPPDCPTTGGQMVQVPKPGGGWYCIDKYEVTQDAYQTFLSIPPNLGDQIADCSANASFTPTCSFNPVNSPIKPVVCVDWCYAHAYCSLMGKRLCGNAGGGTNPPASAADETQSQWYAACSAAGANVFPYGDVYEPTTCNGVNSGFSPTANVGFFVQCAGGYPGLFDMSGNAREWEDSCSGSTCMQRGGGWLDGQSTSPHSLRCDSAGLAPRTQANNEVGFRCCADL